MEPSLRDIPARPVARARCHSTRLRSTIRSTNSGPGSAMFDTVRMSNQVNQFRMVRCVLDRVRQSWQRPLKGVPDKTEQQHPALVSPCLGGQHGQDG